MEEEEPENFLELSDTFSDYDDKADQFVIVNQTFDGLESSGVLDGGDF